PATAPSPCRADGTGRYAAARGPENEARIADGGGRTGIASRSPLSVTIAVSTIVRACVRSDSNPRSLGEKVKTYVRWQDRRSRDHSHPRRRHPVVRREEAAGHGAVARQVGPHPQERGQGDEGGQVL